jgi:Holliday junction resolvase RusA-like endonuclease
VIFIVASAPRTKKTSQQIARVRGRTFIVQDRAKAAYQKTAVEQLQAQLAEIRQHGSFATFDAPVQVRATFYRDKNLGDLVGYMQMIADCLEKAGLVVNDRLIESWDGTRMSKDAANPRTELEVTAL